MKYYVLIRILVFNVLNSLIENLKFVLHILTKTNHTYSFVIDF